MTKTTTRKTTSRTKAKTKTAPYQVDRGIAIDRSKIHLNDWNPNETKPREDAALGESLATYGQFMDLIVRPHPDLPGEYQVIDGEHRLTQLKDDVIYCNVIHGINDRDAKKLTIICNETRGEADKIKLASLLASLQLDFGDDLINALPFGQSELDELIKLAEVDWTQFEEDFNNNGGGGGGGGEDDGWTVLKLKLTSEAMQVLTEASHLIREEHAIQSKDEEIAWGQIIEQLAINLIHHPDQLLEHPIT